MTSLDDKKITVRIGESRLKAYKEGAKCLDLSLTSLVLNAVEEYLFKHLNDREIDDIALATFWRIQKR